MIRRRPHALLGSAVIVAAAASGCAGQDVAASTHPKDTRAVQVGAATWYLPKTVDVAPVASPSSSGSATAVANDPYHWTLRGTGTWDGRAVKVFARPANGVRNSGLLTGQMLGLAQVGGIPTFNSFGGHKVSVVGADQSETLSFSYAGSDGKGQGLWVAAVQSRSAQGAFVQVATPDRPVDPAFAQKVVDSVEFAKR